jgi:hypothetical protein
VDVTPTVVFFAFDSAVSTGEFDTKRFGDFGDGHAIQIGHIAFDAILLLFRVDILQKHKTISTLHIHTIDSDGFGTDINDGSFE